MSSNHPHIDITRSNYEDFFLLYVDGELTPEECDAVEAFAAAHPDLQEELDILLTTRLNAEPVVFFDKDSLMADSMKMTAIDESLLSYIDDELKGEEKAGLEWEMDRNKDLQAQHQLLLKTKLDPTEKIVYPHKAELYRHEQRSVRPMFWLRAAAVVVLVGWGAFWYMDNYTGGGDSGDIAKANTPAPTRTTTPAASQTTPAPRVSVPVSEESSSPAETSVEAYTPAEKPVYTEATPAPRSRNRADYNEPAAEPVVLPVTTSTDVASVTAPERVETIASAPQQIINDPAVTIGNPEPYINVGNGTNEVPTASTAKAENDKKGSMRGFLRKTTRFIERRTGVDPTNEGDELMIGALTINLK